MRFQPRLLQPVRHLFLCSLFFSCIQVETAQTPLATFEVASVRQSPPAADPSTSSWSHPGVGRFTAAHVSLAFLIQMAYGIDDSQISGKPGWLETNLYDIDAKPADGIGLTRDELKPRLQELLHQRFHLKTHAETRSIRGYALVVANGGPRLTPTKADHFPGYRINVSPGQIRGANWSMSQLAKYLAPAAGFPVVNETGITGSYDIGFNYNPKSDADSDLPSLEFALKQATGLLLKPQSIAVETLVIDFVDRVPTAN